MIPAWRTALAFWRRFLLRLLATRFAIVVLVSRLTVFSQMYLPQARGRILHPSTPARQVRSRKVATDLHGFSRIEKLLLSIRDNPCESVAIGLGSRLGTPD
jgi:hypothetical protein